MSDDQPPITVYADYVCPFCYLGHAALEQYRDERETPLSVEYHPFDLRGQQRGPDGELDRSVEDGKDEAYFEQVRENVARLREQYDAGAMLGIDEVPEIDSLPAQIASLWVQTEHPEHWADFDDALYRAYWEDGREIDAPDVLEVVAEDVGVPTAALPWALEDDVLRESVFEQFEAARRAGVTGVPTFVYDEHAARGAVPPEHLRRLVEGN